MIGDVLSSKPWQDLLRVGWRMEGGFLTKLLGPILGASGWGWGRDSGMCCVKGEVSPTCPHGNIWKAGQRSGHRDGI